MPADDALTRLARLARVAEEATAALDLRDARAQLQRLREPEQMTNAVRVRLAEIQMQKRELRRAARAAHLRTLPDLATAELDLKGNSR